MSAYTYTTPDQVVTRKPCKLLSVIVGNDGSNQGWIDVFDAVDSDAAHKVARLYGEGKATQQYRWNGLELNRGLYIQFVSTIEWVTVEWEPAAPGST